jgi:uncharacterized protein YecT (DUF1311 family)
VTESEDKKGLYGHSEKEWEALSDDQKKKIINEHDEELLNQKADEELTNIRKIDDKFEALRLKETALARVLTEEEVEIFNEALNCLKKGKSQDETIKCLSQEYGISEEFIRESVHEAYKAANPILQESKKFRSSLREGVGDYRYSGENMEALQRSQRRDEIRDDIRKFVAMFIEVITPEAIRGDVIQVKENMIDELTMWLIDEPELQDQISDHDMMQNLLDSYTYRDSVARDAFMKMSKELMLNVGRMQESRKKKVKESVDFDEDLETSSKEKSIEEKIKKRVLTGTISNDKAVRMLMDDGWSKLLAKQQVAKWGKESHHSPEDEAQKVKDINNIVIQAFEKFDWDYKFKDDVIAAMMDDYSENYDPKYPPSITDVVEVVGASGLDVAMEMK